MTAMGGWGTIPESMRGLRRWVPAILAAGASAILLLQSQAKQGFWSRSPGNVIFYVAIGGLALKPLKDAAIRAVAWRDSTLKRRIRATLAGALVRMVDELHLNWKEVGVAAYFVRWRLAVQENPTRVRLHVLEQVARERIRNPRHAKMIWTIGKGLVGQCWKTEDEVAWVRDAAWAWDSRRKRRRRTPPT